MLKLSRNRQLEVVSWKEIRSLVVAVNKPFANIVDELEPPDHYKLIKATYFYGDLIINNGSVQFPISEDGLGEINNTDLPQNIKNKLSYQSIPLFLTLKNDNEVFVDTGKRIVPLNLFHQGSLLGVFEAIDFMYNNTSASKWCVSAGVRSIFMLPRITDNLGLNRLRLHYEIPAVVHLSSLQDHWEFFKTMVNHKDFEPFWNNEVLFFTRDWLTKDDVKWMKFKDYIYKQGWEQSRFSIGQVESSLQWEIFAEAIASRNLKPRPYLADQVKHILSIASGKSPAFRPIGSDQQAIPIKGIQDAFLNTYLLKDYIPTLMGICSLKDIKDDLPVYYSLSFPTLLEGTIIDKSTSTIMIDLHEIKLLIETLKKYVEDNALDTSIIHHIDIDYFHSGEDKRGEVRSSSDIFSEDTSFHQGQKNFPNRRLCDTSPFWRGCVRIKTK